MKWVCAIALCAVLAACDVFNPDSGLPMKGEALAQAQARAEHECRLWLEAVEAFRKDYRRYPSGREGLAFLVLYPDPEVHPEWNGPYGPIDRTFLDDPWDFRYQFRTTESEIMVISAGPDRRFDTGDDIRVVQRVDYYAQ